MYPGSPNPVLWLKFGSVYIPLLRVLESLIINNVWIFAYVWRVERRAKRHAPVGLRKSTSCRTKTRAREVASQSFFFFLAFFLSFLPSALLEVVKVLDGVERESFYVVAMDATRAALYSM